MLGRILVISATYAIDWSIEVAHHNLTPFGPIAMHRTRLGTSERGHVHSIRLNCRDTPVR